MKKIRKHVFSWILVITLMISNVSFVFAAEDDSLNRYRDKLEEINIALGTNYSKRQIASTVTFSGGCFAATDI